MPRTDEAPLDTRAPPGPAPLPAYPTLRRRSGADAAAAAASPAASGADAALSLDKDETTALIGIIRARINDALSCFDLRHIDGLTPTAQSFLETLCEAEFCLFRSTVLARHQAVARRALGVYAAHEARLAALRVFPAAVNDARVLSAVDGDMRRPRGRLHLPSLAQGVMKDMLAAAASPGGLAAHISDEGVLMELTPSLAAAAGSSR